MNKPPFTLSLSLDNASILQRIKEGYLLWMNIAIHIPKNSRYTIGSRVENKFLDLLEQTHIAYFSSSETKVQKISACILTLDTLKFLLHIAWEAKLVSHKHYVELGEKLEEVGKMLGGWKGQVIKKTSANNDGSKK